MSSPAIRPTGGLAATSKKRAHRTRQENCVSFINKIPVATTGFAWPTPQTTLDMVATADRSDGTLAVFMPCPARDTWSALDAAPPNVFGLRLRQCEGKKDVKALTCGGECDFCVSLGLSPTRKVLAIFDRLRLPGIKRLEVPEWARTVQPGEGVLFTMETEGPFTFIFSGLTYFYAVRPQDDKAVVVENRLPVTFCTPRYKLSGFANGVYASGASICHAPSVLVQLTFKGPGSLTLTVPNEASHAFPNDQSAWPTRAGYVYNVISKKNAYTCSRIEASECIYLLNDPNRRLVKPADGGAPVFELRDTGLKRLREEEDDDDDDDAFIKEEQKEKGKKKKQKREREEEKETKDAGTDLIEDAFEDDDNYSNYNNDYYDPGFQNVPSDEALSLAQEHEPHGSSALAANLHTWNDFRMNAAAHHIDRNASLMAKLHVAPERSAPREPVPLPVFKICRFLGSDRFTISDAENDFKHPCPVRVNKDATLVVQTPNGEFICGVTCTHTPQGEPFGIETRMCHLPPQLVPEHDWYMDASDVLAAAGEWTTVLDLTTLEEIATPGSPDF